MNAGTARVHHPSWPALAALLAAIAIVATGLVLHATGTFTTIAGHHTSDSIHTVADTQEIAASDAGTTHDTSGSSQTTNQAAAPTVKLTCSKFTGGGFVNFDILVTLSPDGTAQSGQLDGDPYTTGAFLGSLEHVSSPTITITDSGRQLHFHGEALYAVGLDKSISVTYPVPNTCDADYTFPNPASPVIS